MPDSLGSQAVRAVKWATIAQALPKLASPISLIVLARLLSPEDFGVVAAAAVVVSFSQLFWDLGLTKALIKLPTQVFTASHVVFWINVVIALVVVASIYPSAPWIAQHIFHDVRITPVLRVMSLAIIVQALGAVPLALLQRRLNFRSIFWTTIPSAITPLVVAIPLAMTGASYWALIGSNLAAALAQLAILYKLADWRPRFQFDRRLALNLASFGGWVSASSILAWAFKWLDTLLIGAYFGTSTLGAFTIANNFINALFATVLTPIANVMFPVLSKLQSDRGRLEHAFFMASKLTAIVAIGMSTIISLLSPEIVQVLFGPHWAPSAVFLMFLALCHGIASTVALNGAAYRAIGRPDAEFKVMSISMLIRAACYAVSISFGVVTLMAGRLVSVTFGTANHIWFASRFLHTGYAYYFRCTARAFIATACAAALHLLVFDPALESLHLTVRLLSGAGAIGFVFLSVLLPLEGKFFLRIVPHLFSISRV